MPTRYMPAMWIAASVPRIASTMAAVRDRSPARVSTPRSARAVGALGIADDGHDPVAAGDQAPDDGQPDEAGAAGDEDAHQPAGARPGAPRLSRQACPARSPRARS